MLELLGITAWAITAKPEGRCSRCSRECGPTQVAGPSCVDCLPASSQPQRRLRALSSTTLAIRQQNPPGGRERTPISEYINQRTSRTLLRSSAIPFGLRQQPLLTRSRSRALRPGIVPARRRGMVNLVLFRVPEMRHLTGNRLQPMASFQTNHSATLHTS